MRQFLFALFLLGSPAPALAITGKALPAQGLIASAIVMLADDRGDLCTATVLARDVVLTAAHCVTGVAKRSVKVYQDGKMIPVRTAVFHPRFDARAYKLARATADIALVRLTTPLPAILSPVRIRELRRVAVGEPITIAGFGVTAAFTSYGIGIPRQATLVVTGQPGSLQIRLTDPATMGSKAGLGACTGDSGAPAFDKEGQLIGIVGWSTAPNNDLGCGGLTGLTPLLLYRAWIESEAATLSAMR